MAIPTPKLHKATGQAYVYYKGKMKYLGKFGSQDADDNYWSWRATLGKRVAQDFSVSELFDRYEKENKLSKNGKKYLRIIREAAGSMTRLGCDEFGPLAYREVRKAIIAPGNRSAVYVNQTMQTLQRVFKWGVSVEAVTISTYDALRTVSPLKRDDVARKGKGRKAVPRPVVETTLPFLYEHQQTMLKLQLSTGARPGEIVGMRKSQIDRNGPRGTWVYKPEQHKTTYRGKKRHLVFGQQAQQIITDHLAKYPGQGDWVFPSDDSVCGHYTPSALSKAVRIACKLHDIPKWTPYEIRHLRLTEISRDHGIDAAAAIAGHGDLGTTGIYLHQPDAEQIRHAS